MRTISTILLMLLAGNALAATGVGFPNDHAPINVENERSLQRGAKYFVNYCQGCHSLRYQRYNRFARDTGLDDQQVLAYLASPDAKPGDTLNTAMSDAAGSDWFGAKPPDLSLIARSRGADYLYNYLRGFYLDPERPLGVNNSVFPMVGMPHSLWELQGWQKPIYQEHDGEKTITGFELVEPGTLSPDEYDGAVADLVNFLVYVGEPMQLERRNLGFWVILYLLLALVVFYLLKREYWKDVH